MMRTVRAFIALFSRPSLREQAALIADARATIASLRSLVLQQADQQNAALQHYASEQGAAVAQLGRHLDIALAELKQGRPAKAREILEAILEGRS